jgi:hypothetical protein
LMQTETRNCEEFIPTKGKKPWSTYLFG